MFDIAPVTKRKRVLFIIYSYTMGGGSESLLTTIVNNLPKNKYDISIIEVMHSDVKAEPVNDDVHILPYIMSEKDARPRKNMHDLYYAPDKVFEKYIGDQFDVYISFNYQLPSFLLPPERKTISWIHTSIYDLAKPGMERYLELQRGVFEKVLRIVSISDITTQSIKDLYPEYSGKIIEIYNGIDIDNIRNKSTDTPCIILEQPAILFCGRLEERKDPIRLYSVFLHMFLMGKRYHLYYMGYGPLENEIKTKSISDGVDGYVHFLGYQDNPFPIIKQARVCCLLSVEEGFPMCLLECQALGVPFVSTVVGGARILAGDGNCGRVIENDKDAIGAIIGFVENDDREEIGLKCDKSIQRFCLDGYIKKIDNLIDSIASEKDGFLHG